MINLSAIEMSCGFIVIDQTWQDTIF